MGAIGLARALWYRPGTMGVVFALLGLVSYLGIHHWEAQSAEHAKWLHVPGKVIKSEILTNTISEYQPEVVFEYQVGQRKCGSRLVATRNPSYKKQEDAAKVTAKYPVGTAVEVYYNTENFDEGYLEVGPTPGVYNVSIGFGVAGAILMAVGLGRKVLARKA